MMDSLEEDLEEAPSASVNLRLASSFFLVAVVDGMDILASLLSLMSLSSPPLVFFLAAVRDVDNLLKA